MSIDINNDKIQGITIQDTSIHTRVATLGILWRSEDVDIRWNNMIVMAAAISRGIDSDRVIKDYSNYPLGLVKTYDDKNPKPDLAAKIITSVTERSAKFYPSHYNRTMSIYVDWTNEAKKLTKENGTIKYNNIIAFGEPVIRTIDPNAEQMNPHIDDVIGYAGEDDNQLSRIYMIGSAKGKQGLFYIERA